MKQFRLFDLAPAVAVCALVMGAGNTPARASENVTQITAAQVQERYDKQFKPLLEQYCGDCHFDGADKGNLALDKFGTLASIQASRQTWQQVADNLHTKAMPPAKRKSQPSDEERKQLIAFVREALEFCDCTGPRDPGRSTVRRLNRNEYDNTVRDLLGLPAGFKIAAEDFPADDTGYGFDNIADVLTMSPLLIEKYLAAADKALEQVIPTEPPGPPVLAKIDPGQLKGAGNGGGRRGRTLMTEGEAWRSIEVPAEGRYTFRVAASADAAGDEPARMALRVDGADVDTLDVDAPGRAPKKFTVEVRLNAGDHRFAVAFLNDFYDDTAGQKRDRNLRIHDVDIIGPLDAPPPPPGEPYRRLMFVQPSENGLSEADAAAQVLERFASLAYRRPARPEEVSRLVQLYSVTRADGEPHEKALKHALAGALVSPNFLFRIEQDRTDSTAPNQSYFVGDYELATRLSYFLWSSMPDAALFEAASAGKLHERDVLRAQVKRMLADPRAGAFVTNFVGQWLLMRNLAHHSIDRDRIKGFSEELRADMGREVELFFANVVKEDRSVLELLDADYTFVNDRLALLYNLEGVTGNEFRRVSLANNPSRGGVLTMPGVLTVTAMPGRTSPVKRGKFVLEQLLGSAPPPPPPETPSLSDRRSDRARGSVRERFEAHRADSSCISCHARMDPIGFAMENFDAIGRWRDTDNGFKIDATGTLPEGERFDGPAELRKVLVGRKDEFLRTMTEKMLTYALGRGIEPYDQCTVKDVTAAVEAGDHRFSALITAIVESDAFQKRRATGAGETR